jgi:hypothetical protein
MVFRLPLAAVVDGDSDGGNAADPPLGELLVADGAGGEASVSDAGP